MDTLFQVLSVVGVGGIIAVGVWVGAMQTRVSATEKSVDKFDKDHDLLIALNTKVEHLQDDMSAVRDSLASMRNSITALTENVARLQSPIRA